MVVDDEREICTFFTYLLRKKGYEVTAVQSGRKALELITRESFHLALLDLKMPDLDGLTLLKEIKQRNSLCQVIIMTGYSTVKSAIAAMQLGALDYIEKPFDDIRELENLIDRAVDKRVDDRDGEIQAIAADAGIVLGKNQHMLDTFDLARRIAVKNVTVLIQGETGSGKEVMARFIHNCSKRSSNPFIAINCAAISENLLESELFGYERGAFTGADRTRKGFFEIASKGTLFLDEIAEASMSTQAKLLRVLETGEYMRIGGESVNKTDTRIVAATNVILDEAVTNRVFRQDLFFRLDVLTLKIPPLRERKEDIPYFLEYYLSRFAEGKDIVVREFSPETIKLLSDYDWPGNVREMVNLIQRLAAVVDEPVIRPLHLPDKMKNTKPPVITDLGQTVNNSLGQTANNTDPDVFRDFGFNPDLLVEKLQNQLIEEKSLDLNQVLDKLTEFRNMVARNLVKKALAETLGDRQAAALLLGITPRTLKYIYSGK